VRADTIERVDGERLEVRDIVATWKEVRFRRGRGNRSITLSAREVSRIERTSPFLAGARKALEQGDWGSAVAALKKLDSAKAQADWERAEAAFLLGEAHFKSHQPAAAAEAYRAYLGEFSEKDDWWVPYALDGLGQSLLAIGSAGTAEVRFKELAAFGPRWTPQSILGRGRAILAARGEAGAQAARKLFREVAASAADSPTLRQAAEVAHAEALLVAGDEKGVLKDLGRVFFDPAGVKALNYGVERARATLLMSRAYQGLAKRQKTSAKQNLQSAELWALKVATFYAHHADVYLGACSLLADLYGELGSNAEAAGWRERAESAGLGPEKRRQS